MKNNKIIIFEDKRIRRIWHNEEWYYVVEDIVFAITESKDPKQYIKRLKSRDLGLLEGWVQIVPTLLVDTKGGKQRMNCTNTKGAFRIIQSIPSKRAEPFKMWFAQLGQERIEEIEDPEIAQNRVKEYYDLKGYPKSWIDKRLRGIAVRQDLTNEWRERGIKEKKEFAILTDEIHKATFDISTKEHKNLKEISKKSKANLRDNMTDLELIFTMLGEASTTEFTKKENSQGFDECEISAKKGGEVSKEARVKLEEGLGESIVSSKNHLDLTKNKELE